LDRAQQGDGRRVVAAAPADPDPSSATPWTSARTARITPPIRVS